MSRCGNPARASVVNLASVAVLVALWALGCGGNGADAGAASGAEVDTAGPADVAGIDTDIGMPDAIANTTDAVGESEISLDSGQDAAELDLADAGIVVDLDAAGDGGFDVDDLDGDADTGAMLLDTSAVSDAHFDSKYTDAPTDAIQDVVDTAEAGSSETISETDGGGKDCPQWLGAGMMPTVFCTATECCLSPMTAGPCGWITCCAVPEIQSKWGLGESCDSVSPAPPYKTYGPCPAILKYETDVLLPGCNADCWCS